MGNYKVRIYKNTGFNAVNIPDGPELLEKFSYFDCTAIEIFQNRFLSSFRVSASWADIKHGDYLRIYTGSNYGDYYIIQNIKMLAADVAELTVIYDYITSTGGVSELKIIDGVTTRVHVTNDDFGKYCESDPLTIPAQPLQIETKWYAPSTGAHTYIEATVNLPRTGAAKAGKAYTDENGDTVTVPTVRELQNFTSYTLAGHAASVNPHTMLYDLNVGGGGAGAGAWDNQTAILKGIKRCRELGIEQGAIINQVQIPNVYAETTQSTQVDVFVDSDFDAGGEVIDMQEVIDRSILTFTGKTGSVDSGILFRYTGAKNNRVNYGEYTKYGIISCSGESCEFNAEDLKDPNNPNTPVVKFLADPHTDGKPYFRYRVVNGDSSEMGFFKNCVTGLPWKQVPLFFGSPSGTAINTMKYQNSRNIADVNWQNAQTTRNFNAARDIVSGITGAVTGGLGGFAQGGAAGAAIGAAGAIVDTAFNVGGYVIDQKNAENSYAAAKRSEMSDYIVNNTVAAPTINFPYNSEVMRDFYGNGVLMYRYVYSSADISRIDKLLTMYGYRYTKALTKSDFTNKKNFNYVECANVSVTGHEVWMNEGIATMLKSGVRVWHVKPNASLYNETNANS